MRIAIIILEAEPHELLKLEQQGRNSEGHYIEGHEFRLHRDSPIFEGLIDGKSQLVINFKEVD